MQNLAVLDLFVVISYLIGIFFLAYKSSSPKSSHFVEEQYLAGKSLTLTESLCSIIATEVSALTFLGIPAFAYGKDFSFIQIYFGAIIGRVVIAKVMLPLVYDKGLTVYSVLAKTGKPGGQQTIALFYALNKFLAVGVRLFSGSILVAEFFHLNIYLAVFIISIITFFYTLVGGLKAVVKTDIIQMGIFVTGGILAHYLISEASTQSWMSLMSIAAAAGKTNFIDFGNLTPFIIGVLGGILFDMATHGVDQDFVQRLTANASLKGAKIAIISSSFISIVIGLLFLSIGALLWAYYQTNPVPNLANDKIFAHFITTHFPVGIKGLMVAGVLAATMSTLDSSINALSACFYNDIFQHRTHDPTKIKQFYLKDTFMITIIFTAIAFLASLSDGLLMLGLKITSWTAGPLLGIFFMVLVFKKIRLTKGHVITAYISGIIFVYINTFILEGNWNFNVYFGFIASCLTLLLKNQFTSTK